ncbi:MAG: hypothetical protein MUF48_15015 [Pirellulaceae bacterium]|jgi:hypothetical protein|nr:hypothetical protein [Pirellulaceae bacterium]
MRNRVRLLIGALAWLTGGSLLAWWIAAYLVPAQEPGHRVLADLWEFATAPRRIILLEFDGPWPLAVGDPIYRIDGPDAIEQVGEIRRIVADPLSGGPETPPQLIAQALLYPHAPPVCRESYLTYFTTPRSLTWVLETMLPPEKRWQIAREIIVTYETYQADIVQALKPVILGGLADAMEIVEEDLADAVTLRRDVLTNLGRRYQGRLVEQELLPLIRDEIWPIVRRHAEPLANQIGADLFARASLWRFGWRMLYDMSPLPNKELTRAEWNRFLQQEGVPVFSQYAGDILAMQRQVFEEVAASPEVREVLQRNLTQVVDDPEFRQVLWEIFREVLIDNPRLRQRLEERWRGDEARLALQTAADYVEPSVRRIGDLLLGTREAGITPEFAQVLRNQILDKDCRWLVLETPAHARPLEDISGDPVLRVVAGAYPLVNPFAVQLQGVEQ